jgi:hypothetical protein
VVSAMEKNEALKLASTQREKAAERAAALNSKL